MHKVNSEKVTPARFPDRAPKKTRQVLAHAAGNLMIGFGSGSSHSRTAL